MYISNINKKRERERESQGTIEEPSASNSSALSRLPFPPARSYRVALFIIRRDISTGVLLARAMPGGEGRGKIDEDGTLISVIY